MSIWKKLVLEIDDSKLFIKNKCIIFYKLVHIQKL